MVDASGQIYTRVAAQGAGYYDTGWVASYSASITSGLTGLQGTATAAANLQGLTGTISSGYVPSASCFAAWPQT